MSDVAKLQQRVERARARMVAARENLTRAEQQLMSAQRRVTLSINSATTTTAELREHVADMARLHGWQCEQLGRAETTAAWREFRQALRILAERAEGRQ